MLQITRGWETMMGELSQYVCPVLILVLRHLLLVAVADSIDARGTKGRPKVSAHAFLLCCVVTSLLLLIY